MTNIDGFRGPVCPECNGSGQVAYGPWGGRPPKRKCDPCDGTGVLGSSKGEAITTEVLGMGRNPHPGDVAEVCGRYAATPSFEPDAIPRGAYAHIGGGVWFRRCRECDDYVRSYGSMSYLYPFAQHEASHGLEVVGYNAPMMARPA